MPRNGQGVYSLPPVYQAVTGETIQAQQHNVPLEDMAKDMNDPRPISTGGTGGGSAAQARAPENLDVYSRSEADNATINVLKNAAAKAVPLDADGVIISDSEDAGKVKRVLWSVIKDRLRAFFDSLYQPLLSKGNGIELNSAMTANTVSYIDWHSSYPVVDYDFRIIRQPGVDGSVEMQNLGAGDFALKSTGGKFTVDKDLIISGALQTNAGSVNIQANDGTGNAHTWYRNVDGAWRVVTYADKDNGFHISAGRGTANFDFGANGTFVSPGTVAVAGGAAYLNTDGNVYGPRWLTWGSPYAFDATSARIEQRAQDWANTRVSDSRMAGEISAYIYVAGGQFNDLHNSGYVLTRVWHDAANSLNFSSRQPQLYIQNRGWYAAFNF
nr:MAG TPA: hypothetical protein [Caudoviricetes sp.]